MRSVAFFVLFIIFFIACNNEKESDFPVLSVNLSNKNVVSIFDVFEKIEIIPLETNVLSIIKGVGKIEFYNNHYYLSGRNGSFYCFNENGKFIRKIGNEGAGPEEYNYVTDFVINKNKDVMEMLSPFGMLYFYELSGKFAGKIKLPGEVPNYQEIMLLNDSIRILSSIVENNICQLYVYSVQSNSIVNSFYREEPAIFSFNLERFYQYNDSIYFYKPLVSSVFKINQQGYKVAYSWDFGVLNPENRKLDKDLTKEELVEMFKNSQIKGIYNTQFQNDNYYYTRFASALNQNNFVDINVLFDKRDNKKFVFEKFKEDLFFYPIFWCNDYVLASTYKYDCDKVINDAVLDEKNIKKLESIDEEDNPFIIKYYFK